MRICLTVCALVIAAATLCGCDDAGEGLVVQGALVVHIGTPGADGNGMTRAEFAEYQAAREAEGFRFERIMSRGDRIIAVQMRKGPTFGELYREEIDRLNRPLWRRLLGV